MCASNAPLSLAHDLAKDIDYILKRLAAFTLFPSDGRVCLLNNAAAECAIPGMALSRKSWMFYGPDRGGQRDAAMYSLVLTGKMSGIDPQAWLADILGWITSHPVHCLDDLLPWNWKPATSAAAVAA
nr:transposase domain-containing protein [Lichenicoccus roseus]